MTYPVVDNTTESMITYLNDFLQPFVKQIDVLSNTITSTLKNIQPSELLLSVTKPADLQRTIRDIKFSSYGTTYILVPTGLTGDLLGYSEAVAEYGETIYTDYLHNVTLLNGVIDEIISEKTPSLRELTDRTKVMKRTHSKYMKNVLKPIGTTDKSHIRMHTAFANKDEMVEFFQGMRKSNILDNPKTFKVLLGSLDIAANHLGILINKALTSDDKRLTKQVRDLSILAGELADHSDKVTALALYRQNTVAVAADLQKKIMTLA